jgi:hypothetical protein
MPLLEQAAKAVSHPSQVIGLPTLLFLVFLGWRFMPSIRKLQHLQSHIMTMYYAFLWIVGLLNLLRCFALVVEAQYSTPFLLNVLWLMTRFGEHLPLAQCPLPTCSSKHMVSEVLPRRLRLCYMAVSGGKGSMHPLRPDAITVVPSAGLVMLEVSVVVFLLQGYLTSGREVKPNLALSPDVPVIQGLERPL